MNAPTGGMELGGSGDLPMLTEFSDPGETSTPTALTDFILLNSEIASLVRAGVPLEPHLAQLGRDLPGKAGELAEKIGRRLEAGESLAQAMQQECGSLPPTYRAAIIAGAQSGQLGAALEALVESASRIDQLRRVTGVALVYPLLLTIVVCGLLAFTIVAIVPAFEWLEQFQFGPIRWLATWPYTAPILSTYLPALLLLAAAFWWWRSGHLGGRRTARFGWLAWLPGGRRIRRWSQAATFSELLLLLVERGLPLDESLLLAAESAGDKRLQRAAAELAEQTRRGEAITPLSGTGGKDRSGFPLLIRLALYHTGDRALLAGGLRQAAAMYRQRAIRATEWYSEYLPILLTVVVCGTLTVVFTLLIIWPYAAALHNLADWNWR